MLDCFLDYSVNPNLRFHSRIDKIIDDVIREKINIPHKFRMRLESRHCVESRIIYFRFRVLDKACLQCNVFLKGLSEEMKEALSDERIDFAVIYDFALCGVLPKAKPLAHCCAQAHLTCARTETALLPLLFFSFR